MAVAEGEPEVVARGRSASAGAGCRAAPEGTARWVAGLGAVLAEPPAQGWWPPWCRLWSWRGVDVQIPRWTVASLLTCSCFPHS